jgi:hypothetical protein
MEAAGADGSIAEHQQEEAQEEEEEEGDAAGAEDDLSTVRQLLQQMRSCGSGEMARVDALIDPASVSRSWIRRGRVFWLQQRCHPDTGSDTERCCCFDTELKQQQQQQQQGSDAAAFKSGGDLLGGVLSYDRAQPLELRFGFRRARYRIPQSDRAAELSLPPSPPPPTTTEAERVLASVRAWLAQPS